MARFRHSAQLRQLARLDPQAANQATWLLYKGKPGTAAKIITERLKWFLSQPRPVPADLQVKIAGLIESGRPWANGESVTIWECKASGRRLWIKNEGGILSLVMFQDAPRLKDRRYSPGLRVGSLDPGRGCWVVSPDLFSRWAEWESTWNR